MPLYLYTGAPIQTSTGTTIRYVSVAPDGTVSDPGSYTVASMGGGDTPDTYTPTNYGAAAPSPVYLVEITAHNGTEVVTLRYATSGVVVDGNYYEPRIINPGSIRSMLFGEGTTFGASSTGYGEIVLVNSDGALDALIGYGLSGRNIMIKKWLAGVVTLLAACTGEQATVTTEQVALRIKDPSAVFNVPVQSNKYGGTNALPAGVDGTDDIKGKEQPLVFGVAYNITPVLVNTSKLIYQANDGALQPFLGVYDKGVKLTRGSTYSSQSDMEANAPAAGEYRAWLAGGMFRIGSSPAGQVTCDAVEGATAADRTAAQIAKRIALRKITTNDLIAQDFTDLDVLNSAEIGIYINGNTTIRAALDEVLGSIGGWWAFDADGKLNVGRLDAPSGTATASLTASDIFSLDRVATNDEGRGVPAYHATLDYRRNYTVQGASELAGSVPNISAATWTPAKFPVTGNWWDVAYGNGKYAVLRFTATENNLAVSTDGINWSMRAAAMDGSTSWNNIYYVNGRFFLAASTKMAHSTDLVNWTVVTLPLTSGGFKLAYANGLYVAMGYNQCITSPDLVTWTSRTITGQQWTDGLAYGNGRFVAVSGASGVLWSADGITWTNSTSLYPAGIAHINGVFVAHMGADAYNSIDGVNWQESTLPIAPAWWSSLTTGNGAFVLFSNASDVNTIAVSMDGINWTQSAGPTDQVYDKALVGKTTTFMLKLGTDGYSYAPLSASPSYAQFVGAAYRTTTAADVNVLTQHLNASTLNFSSLMISAAAAQTEATRLLNLYKVRRDYIVVTCPRSALPTQLPVQGKTIKLTYPRFGYDTGKLFTFLGYEQHLDSDEVTLYLWG